jgi:hypothetical protein
VVPALLAQPATYLVVAFWWPMLTGLGIAVGVSRRWQAHRPNNLHHP